MNIPVVIQALRELSVWLECSRENQEVVIKVIKELEKPNIGEVELKQLKRQLSKEILFHPKCLGDLYISTFTGDGTAFAWWNYLSQIADICQKNL